MMCERSDIRETIEVSFADAPFEIMDGDRGKHYPKQDELLPEGECLFLSANNVTKQGFSFSNKVYISAEKDRQLRKGKLKRGDIVLTTRGTLGNVGYYSAEIPYDDLRINSGMVIIRANAERILPSYLYCFLRSQKFQDQVNGLRSGVAQPQIPIRDLKAVKITIPPLPTQKHIADILSAYDDLIENNRRRVEILEKSARLIFKERFGEEDTTGVLADICEEIRRAVKPSDVAVDTPYIGLEHMPRRSISLCQWEGAGKVTSTKHGFNEGEILFGKIRPYFHKVGLAFVDGVASSDAIVIRPLKAELRNYVLLTVSSDDFVAAASQGMKEGSKMPRADWGLLLKYPVPIPAEKTLANFNQLIEPIMQQLKALCFTNRKLAEARDVLLPKLMRGAEIG